MNRHAQGQRRKRASRMSKKRTQETTPNPAETATPAAHKKSSRKQKGAKKAGVKRPASDRSADARRAAKTKRAGKSRAKDRSRESKTVKILDLITRPQGATLPELIEATSWQAHSVRGFLSMAAKKQALKIESTRNESGQRHYRVKA